MEDNGYTYKKSEKTIFKNKNNYFMWGITLFLVIIGSISFYLLVSNFANVLVATKKLFTILMPVIDGFVIAYLLTPIINKIESVILKKKNLNYKQRKLLRTIDIIVVLLLFFFIIYELFAMVLPEITANIFSIKDNSNEYIENIDGLVNDFYNKNPELGKNIEELWNKYSDKVIEWLNSNVMTQLSTFLLSLTTGIFSAVKFLFNFVIGIIISIYFMSSKETYAGQAKKLIYALFDKEFANILIHNTRFTNKTFNGFIVGKVIDSAIIGMICYIITTLIGTPYPLLISIIIGVTNIIPFFGPFIGAVPCAILILFINPIQCLYFIIMIFFLQQFDGNILGPKIIGDSTGLQGFWVIFAITLFGGLFGVLGMFIGVPLFAVMYAAFKAFIKSKLEFKNLKKATSDYIDVDYITDDNEYILNKNKSIFSIDKTDNNDSKKKSIKDIFKSKK